MTRDQPPSLNQPLFGSALNELVNTIPNCFKSLLLQLSSSIVLFPTFVVSCDVFTVVVAGNVVC